ncbi:MAG: hypothetical protein KFB96_20155 [Thiocapsa sp.]|uniref:hypothetical protein n=1 Tax=Thiocapsa sp. TaxID=2024551 RepID=UPI001BCE8CDF|nr:hypothetical protein [Thiocapsa sp.]QVL47947.1 MAG: hypothetical protein KFB96_20155 [Thiocapsa sp.]
MIDNILPPTRLTLVTQLPLRHHELKLCFTTVPMSDWWLVGFVKRSFVSRVAKRELRDQGNPKFFIC